MATTVEQLEALIRRKIHEISPHPDIQARLSIFKQPLTYNTDKYLTLLNDCLKRIETDDHYFLPSSINQNPAGSVNSRIDK
jgi:hypothetical protein